MRMEGLDFHLHFAQPASVAEKKLELEFYILNISYAHDAPPIIITPVVSNWFFSSAPRKKNSIIPPIRHIFPEGNSASIFFSSVDRRFFGPGSFNQNTVAFQLL